MNQPRGNEVSMKIAGFLLAFLLCLYSYAGVDMTMNKQKAIQQTITQIIREINVDSAFTYRQELGDRLVQYCDDTEFRVMAMEIRELLNTFDTSEEVLDALEELGREVKFKGAGVLIRSETCY